ncbi:unnamed protein product, partial [Ectocarpus sp. 6 AP-2014]
MADGKEEKVIAEGRALLSVTPGVFYSDHQVLQRDLSVAVLRAYRQFALEGSLRPAPKRRHPSSAATAANNNSTNDSNNDDDDINNSNDDDHGGVVRIGGLHVGRHGYRDEAPRGGGGGKEDVNGGEAEAEDFGGGGASPPERGAATRVLRLCDVLAGGGVRAIRYALEAGPVEVLANDHSEE